LTILTAVTLASSNNALPEDGDCTKTYWSCFNVNFNTFFKQFSSALVGKQNFDNIKMHGTTVKIRTHYLTEV